MKLRNFLYLNTKVLEDYIAAIDGYTTTKNLRRFQPAKRILLREKELLESLLETVLAQANNPKK